MSSDLGFDVIEMTDVAVIDLVAAKNQTRMNKINRRPTARRPLSERWRMINRARSRTRACGEHAFRVVKQLWGFTKVRYRGLSKNLARAQTMFALANLYQLRHQLLPAGARSSL
jgi:IS5 family transposase